MTESIFQLQILSGPETGRVYNLTAATFIVGRYPLADIVIDDPSIGYRHAMLTRDESTYWIADLESDAGTYVNGQRIGADPVALVPGDIILLGTRLSAAFHLKRNDSDEPIGETPSEQLAAESTAVDQHDLEDANASKEGEYFPPERDEQPVVVDETPESPADDALASSTRVDPAPSGHAGPLPAMPPPQKSSTGRILWIAAGCLVLLLACCCSATLFMYFIGGDWLLNQLGTMP